MSARRDGVSHWDDVYAGGDAARSWFQACPLMSLQMLDAAGVTASDSLIDVGGGASHLAGALLGRGFRDITVLDVSVTGMQCAQDRLGEQAQQVQWLAADVLAWQPLRRFRVWHDRAVFRFLTSPPGQHRYVRVLDAATETDAVAVFGCFAPDGPQRCSGLPVARYDIPALAGHLGPAWTLRAGDREEHITPAGVMQPFTWAAFCKAPGSLDRKTASSSVLTRPLVGGSGLHNPEYRQTVRPGPVLSGQFVRNVRDRFSARARSLQAGSEH